MLFTLEDKEAFAELHWEKLLIERQSDEFGWLDLWKLAEHTGDRKMYNTYDAAKEAAYEFTLNRLKEIHEVQQEMEFLNNSGVVVVADYRDEYGPARERILKRLEKEMQRLITGMKQW